MEWNNFALLGPLAVGLAFLLRVTALRFSRAEKAVNRLWLALAMLALLFAAHAEVLYVALDVTDTLSAFGPAMAASIAAAVLGGSMIVLCYVFRKKRKLSEMQKMELKTM